MERPSLEFDYWISNKLFDAAPIPIAVIDRDFNIARANSAFESTFGPWENRRCYEVYKNRDSACRNCIAAESFRDGRPRVTHERGVSDTGETTRYIKHSVPVVRSTGEIPYLVEMSIDVTAIEKLRRENELLFEMVPCNVMLLDSDLRIVRANGRVEQQFGDVVGKYCYEVLKDRPERCSDCPAQMTLDDGRIHAGRSIKKNAFGQTAHFQVLTAPVGLPEEDRKYVLEMAVDISEEVKLQDELKLAHNFLDTLISVSMDGIVSIDDKYNVLIVNRAAKQILGLPNGERLSGAELERILPAGFFEQVFAKEPTYHLPETNITNLEGEEVPVRLIGVRLEREGTTLGGAAYLQDQRKLKILEREKLEAERLAAVGQTVAGLAHGVKNLLTGLEGGMYLVSTGLTKNNLERVESGWEMLNRNIGRIKKFVMDFLSFSKGRVITAEPSDPVAVAREVVELYAKKAEEAGIELVLCTEQEIPLANLDYEGMHECLTNLVGNAIDACQMSEQDGRHVTVRVSERDDTIIYEVVDDGVGMDYELKKKVFTTFFTTKGLGGTGIGLLTTRRIVQEHGGRIDMESAPGEGSTFTIRLRRNRLPRQVELPEPE